MSLNIQTFTQLVQTQAAAIQAAASQVIDFAQGSVMRALVQANAAVALWLESLIVRVLSLTRAATSSGADLDTWMADFGFTRLGATAAKGTVTFSRYTSTHSAFVPVGAQVQTSDKSQTFTVIADATNLSYSATLGGYTIAANIASLGILVQAVTAGGAGNAAAGTITVIYGSLPGIDYVSNAGAFAGGTDAESDGSFRGRFPGYLASLSKATETAIKAAVAGIQSGAYCTVTTGYDYAGNPRSAYFYAVADDGSGTPGSSFMTAAGSAIEAVRPAGINYAVYSPVVVNASVSMTLTTDSSYTHSTLVAAVASAVTAYIKALKLGSNLPYTKLAAIAYDVSPGVLDVTAVTLNSSTSDLTATSAQVIRPLTITVN